MQINIHKLLSKVNFSVYGNALYIKFYQDKHSEYLRSLLPVNTILQSINQIMFYHIALLLPMHLLDTRDLWFCKTFLCLMVKPTDSTWD